MYILSILTLILTILDRSSGWCDSKEGSIKAIYDVTDSLNNIQIEIRQKLNRLFQKIYK